MILGTLISVAETVDDVVGKELAIEGQHRFRVALVLLEKLLKLGQQLGQVGPNALAPVTDAGIRRGQEAHEDVRAANTIPARLARQADGLAQGAGGPVVQPLRTDGAARLKYIIHGQLRHGHGASSFGGSPALVYYGERIKAKQAS